MRYTLEENYIIFIDICVLLECLLATIKDFNDHYVSRRKVKSSNRTDSKRFLND